MKNNRQIGLDGKVFISACMHRGPLFVIILVFYGLLTAVADILKLTGASGVAMSPFTTTLLLYDFVVSLMLIVVIFYAYFLECGANVPVLKEKPIMVFGLFRLGYYVLLAYYICYRAMYCIVNRDSVPASLSFFYFVYLGLIILLILANCYIFNTLARNIIRRSYGKSFHRLAACGIILQALLPIAYIFARIFMQDLGDEYFTTAVCDLIRLCICPILLTSIWFLFLHGVEQVKEIYGEVDSALRSKQYQITYTADGDSKKSRNNTHKASATVLPAPSASSLSLPAKKSADTASSEPKAIPSAIETTAAAVAAGVSESAASADNTASAETADTSADAPQSEPENNGTDTTAASDEKAPNVPADVAAAIAAIDDADSNDKSNDEIIADFAAEARKAVAKTSSAAKPKPQQPNQQPKSRPQNNSQQKKGQPSQNSQQRKQQRPQGNGQNQSAKPKVGSTAPVQEFDPFPADSVPRRPQQNGQQNRNNQNQRQGGHAPNNRPQGNRPAQRSNNTNNNNRSQHGSNSQRNNSGRR